jgi:hypothetical protein
VEIKVETVNKILREVDESFRTEVETQEGLIERKVAYPTD